jgi:hypothetical protein
MKDSDKRPQTPKTQELVCTDCGGKFIFRAHKQDIYSNAGWEIPKRCFLCQKAKQEKRRKEAEQLEAEKRQQNKAAEQRSFDLELELWNVISMDKVKPKEDHVLYIIGNGFDLMHGVPSSYYAFRDSMGKNSRLRSTLEQHLTPEDIWADFEGALAQFDVRFMGSRFMVDNYLDMFEAYDEDAGAAEFFGAVELAAEPITTIADELPRRFRSWVETLSIGTADRPLANMFRNGKVLCFNYTEFVETLYHIPEENICYIHGCRRKKKGHPKEKLILGHLPGASDGAFDFEDNSYVHTRNPYKRQLIEVAQEYVFHLIAKADEGLTKKCGEIIAAHQDFFTGLYKIEDIIVIGHSFSSVDWDYFSAVLAGLSEGKSVHWYFGCHGLRDLQNLTRMLKKLGIPQSSVSVFRTDRITVSLLEKPTPRTTNWPVEKTRCVSADGRWLVKTIDCLLQIIDQETDQVDHEVLFSTPVNGAFFDGSGNYLFLIIRGADPGILLFSAANVHWELVGELESMTHQSLINVRLKHVFLTAQEITFVYNNRVRQYSLADGELIYNRAIRNARNFSYQGTDIMCLFQK